jgi:hypothetical protein
MCAGVLAMARDASAQFGQAWTDRGYAALNVGFETTSGDLQGGRSFSIYGETGTTSTSQAVDSGALFDIAAGARVWRNVSVGIAYHRESTNGEGVSTAVVPNPAFTDRPRSVTLNVGDLGRTENAVHIQFGYMLPINEELSVHVMLGPSFFSLSQDVVGDLTFAEAGFPFTTVNAEPVIDESSDSAVGFNVGVDVSYKFYETTSVKIGAGAFLRYAGATVDVGVLDNTVGSDVGGIQIGFGGRIRF